MKIAAISGFLLLMCSLAAAQTAQGVIVAQATTVLDEIMAAPATKIPHHLLRDAQGLVIIPNMVKGGFVVGVRHGKGVALVRNETGAWTAPQFVTMTGGSIGWQVGVQSTDLILVFRTQNSVAGLLEGKITIGADAAAAAGPVGRQAAAATDARLRAEILSWSRSRGLFAGVSLDGSVLEVDQAAAAVYYQTSVAPAAPPEAQIPPSAIRLIETIVRYCERPAAVAGGLPPGATLENVVVESPVDQSASLAPEEVRTMLAASADQMFRLLDEQWKGFLAVPREVHAGDVHPSPDALRLTLSRYDAVAGDARFAALSSRREFQTTRRLLQAYLETLHPPAPPTLQLPAPPAGLNEGPRR